ncbi:ComEA family DNA-binding protein [Streptomyces bohaiensis]|uniref:ComEA family DNA-binding protein n=1 Tax=Streptomyces bohaiensis TaxID=1431344 RepID=A0ABX1C3N6_9ACTN|nr:ComEA family DNA-binding protein [Streptomyces bohaiensis]NJQ13844.1 ComEA family DNA-binding protein [Streptomyces bohaiensis]
MPDPASFAKDDDAALPTGARAEGAADLPADDPAPPPNKLPVALRARLACQDALSGWVLPRCGVEPRTLAAAGVVLAIAVGFAAHHYWTGRPQDVTPGDAPAVAVSAPGPEPTSASGPPLEVDLGADRDQTADSLLVVDVAGDVVEPGLRTLPPGSRVGDAIDAAGGPTPGTETTLINRARPLTDGEHILVGGDGDGVDAGTSPAPPLPGFDSQGKVRLNTATADDLEELPGVGPVLAGNIVAHREQHGHFTSVDQLIAVSGIGETRLADLRDRVVL